MTQVYDALSAHYSVPDRISRAGNICGRFVQKARTKRRWTQTELATQCQLSGWDASRDMIAKIENHSRIVSDYELKVLAEILQADVREWLR